VQDEDYRKREGASLYGTFCSEKTKKLLGNRFPVGGEGAFFIWGNIIRTESVASSGKEKKDARLFWFTLPGTYSQGPTRKGGAPWEDYFCRYWDEVPSELRGKGKRG